MRIRMLTTAAGPAGVWPEGSVQLVDDETARALIAGDYAVAVDVAEPLDADVARETAEAPPQAERATAPQAKKRTRKSTARRKTTEK